MTLVGEAILPNLLYLSLVAGLWLAALAVVTPGTGALELLALLALLAAGLGTLVVPLNLWAVALLGVGTVLYGVSFWRRREPLWLALAALALIVGSAFLFRSESGGPAVHPVLAGFVSLITLGFFWLAVRKAMAAQFARPSIDPSRVIGEVGEVRTRIDPLGSVHVGRELWTARAEVVIPEGASVVVKDREGLVLLVEPEGSSAEPAEEGGESDA